MFLQEYQDSNRIAASAVSPSLIGATAQPSPSRQGTTGQVIGRRLLLSGENNLPHSPRQSTTGRSPRRRLVFSGETNVQSPRPSSFGEGPRRRRRRQRYQMSAAEARERLVNVSQTRAQAAITNSCEIQRGVRAMEEIVTVLRNIEAR